MNVDKQKMEQVIVTSACPVPDHQLHLAGLQPADVDIVIAAGPKIQIGDKFPHQVQTFAGAADSLVAALRAQTGIEACRSPVTLGPEDHTLSVALDLGPDACDGDVCAVALGYVARLVTARPNADAASGESMPPLTAHTQQVLNQATHATLMKRGRGTVGAPFGICFRGRELARVEGQYQPKPNLSDPRPEDLPASEAHIIGWNRKLRRGYLEVKFPGSKNPEKVTVNWDKYSGLGQEVVQLSLDPNNKVKVILRRTRDTLSNKRYELLFIEPA